jgi:hypothetical protein
MYFPATGEGHQMELPRASYFSDIIDLTIW